MKIKNLLISILVSVGTIGAMVLAPYILLKRSPDAGLGALALIAPFAFFPFNHFTALVFTLIFSAVASLLLRKWTHSAASFLRIFIYSIIIVQLIVSAYNIYELLVIGPQIQEYNSAITQSFEEDQRALEQFKNTAAAGNFIFFEKNAQWGPCPKQNGCFESIVIWSGGLLQYQGADRTYEKQLTDVQVEYLVEGIIYSGILKKSCTATPIVDYAAKYVFHPYEKTITYPECKEELDQIDAIIARLTSNE